MANTPTYDVNYDDERFGQVESDKSQALTELEQTYGGMIDSSDKYFDDQIQASKDWADKQAQIQQDNTDFAIEQIEQQKEQANKDYLKEQSGAYVDWRKQSNQYGTEAEKMASAGLDKTGYSESSQVSMYNTYQNRVSTAREVYSRAVLNYDNAIKDAQLQNNAALAEIAYKSLQQQLELSLQGFQYKNQLILEQANKKVEIDNIYYNRYQDVLQQINTENAMAEGVRQYEKNYELQVKQIDEQIRQFEMNYELKIKEFEEGIRQFNAEIERLKKKDAQEYALEIKNLELKKQQLAEEQRQFNAQMSLQREQLEVQRTAITTSGGSSGGGSSSSGRVSGSSSGKSGLAEVVSGRGTPALSTRDGAIKYMRTHGVDSGTIAGLLTQSEWSRRRTSYKTYGTGNAAVKNYNSYEEYLNAYATYAVNNAK